MLVLNRKRNQTIRIGDDIVIHVLQVKGSTIRLGIEAPDDKRILRGELPTWNTMPVEEIRLNGSASQGPPNVFNG